MADEEYEAFAQKRMELDKEIMHTSLLLSTMKDNGKCPYCNSNIGTKDEIREGHIKDMQEYNKFSGRNYYIAHIEGDKRWEILEEGA